MMDIKYKIAFFSNWHCGSGLAAGADVDELVIKDSNKLPYVPGRTVKGLLREAANMLSQFKKVPQDSVKRIFEFGGDDEKFGSHSIVSFTDATLCEDEKLTIINNELTNYLYMSVTSTAIDEKGLSLRKIETTIPCNVYGTILNVANEDVELLLETFKWVKRLGLGRNRGYGRCEISKED